MIYPETPRGLPAIESNPQESEANINYSEMLRNSQASTVHCSFPASLHIKNFTQIA